MPGKNRVSDTSAEDTAAKFQQLTGDGNAKAEGRRNGSLSKKSSPRDGVVMRTTATAPAVTTSRGPVPGRGVPFDPFAFFQQLLPAPIETLRFKLFLTVKEAAQYSGLPVTVIRRLVRRDKLPAVKAGGWRIKRKYLEQLDLRHIRSLSGARRDRVNR